jgi:hypothetical protein
MPMPQQVADERAVVRDLARAGPIADASRLHDGPIVAHHIDQADKAVIQHGEFLPPQLLDEFLTRGHQRLRGGEGATGYGLTGYRFAGYSPYGRQASRALNGTLRAIQRRRL